MICALYLTRHSPPIPGLTRSLQVDLKELRNFVTDIHNDRRQTDDRQTTDRTTDRTTNEALYTFTQRMDCSSEELGRLRLKVVGQPGWTSP
uniref:Uncharacterized protein n=1 Tax=Haemonchus contortus TaxID=6289 RepID=A0A7I5EAC4_HAECO